MARGILVSFEGIDQCGKNTQIRLLSDWLEQRGVSFEIGREPGGTSYGEAARRLLQDPQFIPRLNNAYDGVPGTSRLQVTEELTPQGEAFGYLLARSQFSEECVLPVLSKGSVFIADRCGDSSTAYQGYGMLYGDEQAVSFIKDGNRFALRDTPIIRTYLLDISSQERLLRRKDDIEFGMHKDRIELRDSAFFERVRHGYLRIAEQEPERFVVIDGTLPIKRIHEKITEDFKELLEQHDLLPRTL